MRLKTESLVVGIAPTYDPLDQCGELYCEAAALLESMGVRVMRASQDILSEQEAKAVCAEFEAAGVDLTILMCCRLVGDGAVITPFMHTAAALAVWCLPEPTATGPLMLNSMTCANLYMSAAKQLEVECRGKKVKWLYGGTSHPLMAKRLRTTVSALKAKKCLEGATLIQIGNIPSGFTNLTYSVDAIKRQFGTTVKVLPLDMLIDKMDTVPPHAVTQLTADMKNIPLHSTVLDIEIEKNARLVLAIEVLKEEFDAAAFAIACWPEFQADLKFSTCLAFAWLNEKGIIVSCEGDLPGALTMLVVKQMSGEKPMLMDPVAMDTDTDVLSFWHCGMGMPCYADNKGCTYTKYPCDSRILDLPGVSVDMKFAPQPVTISRLSGKGAERLLACQASIVEGPNKGYDGARGWFSNFTMSNASITAPDFFNTMCTSGNPHHYIICAGHAEAALREFAHYCGLEVINASYCDEGL